MKKILFLFILFVAAISYAAEKRNLVIEDNFAFKDLSDANVSPDGKWIAFVIKTTNLKTDKADRDVYMVSTAGGPAIQLTSSEKNDTHPRWSPDNKVLAFLSKRTKNTAQVFLLNRNGGDPTQLTEFKQGVSDFAWSPDSKKLLLTLSDPDPNATDDEDKDKDKTAKPIIITRLQFMQDGTGYLNDLRDHLYIFDVAAKTSKQITSGPYDDSNASWSPDGKTILFASNRTENPDANRNSDIFVVSADGGDPKKITTNPGSDSGPAWSPDGKWIAYDTTTKPELMWYATQFIAIIPASGGTPKILTESLDRNCDRPQFSPDGKTLYFRLEDRGTDKLASIPASGGAINRDVAGENEVLGYNVGASGTIGFIASRHDLYGEAFVNVKGKSTQLTKMNAAATENIQLAKVERIEFKSKDGTPVEGFVYYPPQFDPSKKWPLVLRIHGGPTEQINEQFSFERQLLAANGYVTLAINPRGSTGYGVDFCKAIFADWGNKDFEDLMAGVDALIAKGFIDTDHMGVGGWSYGGIMTDYVITKTDRFKAATSGASEFNYLANYGVDHYQYEWETELGLPWEHSDLWIKLSPFFHVANVKTPTLVMCGQDDMNVPLINSEQLYQALRRLGVDTMLVAYPNQPHAFFTPSYIKDRFERYLAWYGHYLQGKAEKVPAAAKATAAK